MTEDPLARMRSGEDPCWDLIESLSDDALLDLAFDERVHVFVRCAIRGELDRRGVELSFNVW